METVAAPAAPPQRQAGAWAWARVHLFDGPWNTALTLVVGLVLAAFARGALAWVLRADWAVVTHNLRLWTIGVLPLALIGRAYWAGGLVVVAAALTVAGLRLRAPSRALVGLWAATLIGVAVLMAPIRIDQIGGLYLTVLLAASAITLSFPLGVLLGTGRTSSLPVVRWVSTAYIEVVRGVPLVTVLLWFSVFATLVSGDAITKVQRAIIALTLFSGAYVGEIVRGGILAVGRGQVEAARALGLSASQTMLRIVMPQALRTMIPALVGQFISLFKDTSLTVIIGLTELVGVGRSILAITEFLHAEREVFTFLLVVYFVFSYTLSYASRRLETRLGVGER